MIHSVVLQINNSTNIACVNTQHKRLCKYNNILGTAANIAAQHHAELLLLALYKILQNARHLSSQAVPTFSQSVCLPFSRKNTHLTLMTKVYYLIATVYIDSLAVYTQYGRLCDVNHLS